MYVCLHIKYPIFFSDLKIDFSRQIFEKYPNIKFNENPSSGNPVVPPDGQMDRHNEDNRRYRAILRICLKKKRPPGTPMCKQEQIVNWI